MYDDFAGFMASYVPIAGAETPPQTAPPEGGEGGETQAQPPQVDLSPLTERMDDVASRIGSLEERLPAGEPQPGMGMTPEEELGQYGPGYGQPQPGFEQQQPGQYQPGYDPNDPYAGQMYPQPGAEANPQAVLQMIRDEATRAAQAAWEPQMQRQHQERLEAESMQLLEDYPELQQRETQQTLGTDANQWAEDIAGSILGANPQLAQAMAGSPAFLELVHLAAKTAERAGEETPPGQGQGNEVALQTPAAANQGGGEGQPNLGEQIQQAGSPKSRFWTG